MAGVPLLPGILPAAARLIVEIPFGANLNIDSSNWALQWVDVTTDLWQANGQRINISPMGRSERFDQAQPAGCSFVLDNSTGKYSKGPASSNYPFVRPNTPVRITVTLNGITLFVRFFGYIESWEPHDDTSAKVAWVTVTAWGKTHMLDLKDQPLQTPLTRAILKTTAATLRQFWPCEDGDSSTQAASALVGQPPLVAAGTVRFAAMDYEHPAPPITLLPNTHFGTGKLPQLREGGSLSATFAPGSSTSWTIQAAAFDDVSTNNFQIALLEWRTSDGAVWRILTNPSTPATWVTYNGATVATVAHLFIQEDLRVDAVQSGGNISVTLDVRPTDPAYTASGSVVGKTLAGVVYWASNPDQQVVTGEFSVGQVRVWDANTAPDFKTSTLATSAWNAYNGETATDRLTRLCGEEGLGLPLVLTGSSTMAMGPQKPSKFVDLLRECESADLGVLYDGMSQGLNYIARRSKYNQTATLALNAATGQLAPPVEPKDQDPQRRNLWVIGRRDGSTVTVTDKTGPLGTDNIGTLAKSVSDLNLFNDAQLSNIGGWLLRLGTVNEPYQYPKLNLDLSAIPSLAFNWLSTGIGERIDITNLSAVASRHPPGMVSLILEGYSEVLSPYEWTVQANCSPEPPWEVIALDQTFRLEMAGQTLASSLAPGATTLSLATAAGHQLHTRKAVYPNDFPPNHELLLNVGGWPIRVTDATGTSSPQTLTIDPAPNLTTLPAGTPVTQWHPSAPAL